MLRGREQALGAGMDAGVSTPSTSGLVEALFPVVFVAKVVPWPVCLLAGAHPSFIEGALEEALGTAAHPGFC